MIVLERHPVKANSDGYHMWGRKCSLFPEHLISLYLGSSPIHYIYMYYIICQSEDYVYGIMTDLFAWIGLTYHVSSVYDPRR